MKHIVVIGGGVGGVSAAKQLCRRLQAHQAKITIVNPLPYHILHADLYEIATSPEELTTNAALAATSSFQLRDMFPKEQVEVLEDWLTAINYHDSTVTLAQGGIQNYDYVIVAMGAGSDFHHIPGAEKYSLQLRNVKDALRIRHELENMIAIHSQDMKKPYARLVVLGGGVAGVELAAESVGALNFICWKYGYSRHKAEVMVVEAANDLASGLGSVTSQKVFNRLQKLGVIIKLNMPVSSVDQQYLQFGNGEKLHYDLLVWAGGIKPMSQHCSHEAIRDQRARVKVDQFLMVPGTHNAFMVGDLSCIYDAHGTAVPATATQAMHQGAYVGQAIAALICGKEVIHYTPQQFGYSIPLGGRWALVLWRGIIITGYIGYLMREFEILRYHMHCLGVLEGFKHWLLGAKLYSRNDG